VHTSIFPEKAFRFWKITATLLVIFLFPFYIYSVMRFLLFIPVIVLFLSNVPFTAEMRMEKMMAQMQEKDKCCKKNDPARKGSCHAAESNAPMPQEDGPSKECCQRTETTCHCTCCFHFAAPFHEVNSPQFGIDDHSALQTGFIPAHWKDPHIAAPGQPPDVL